MKKAAFLFLFLVVVFPLISAIEINMPSDIPQGETIIASVSGNFIDPITKSDISFYRGHLRTSFDYDIAKIGDNYSIYIQTTNKVKNNYSINISGVNYRIGSQVSNKQVSKTFEIINETADFSVNPGFIITNGNFSIKIQNLQPVPITIKVQGTDVEQSINLSSGQIKNLYINLEDISETTIRTITLSTENTEYNIPCYVIIEGNPNYPPEENITIEENKTGEENTTIEENITVNNETKESCSFFNKLFNTCQNETQENKTSNNQTSNNSSSNVDYEVVEIGNKTVAIKNGEVLNESATSKTCAQIKGKVCASGEICQNSTIYAKDAKCCISECVKEETNASTKIIGWAIVGILFIIILRFFIVRFRRMKKKKDTLLGAKR